MWHYEPRVLSGRNERYAVRDNYGSHAMRRRDEQLKMSGCDAPRAMSGRDEPRAVNGRDEQLAMSGRDEPRAVNGRDEPRAVSGRDEQLSMSGRKDKLRAIRGSDGPQSRKELDGTGACNKFCLLMWKNFLQQKRHRTQTIVEVLLPVISMAMVLILRSEIQPTYRSLRSYPMLAAHSLQFAMPVLAGMNYSQMSIAYSPESPVLQDVLNKAANKFISLNSKFIQEKLPVGSVSVKVNAYKNSEKLKGLYLSEQETRIVIAGVEFDDKLSAVPERVSEIIDIYCGAAGEHALQRCHLVHIDRNDIRFFFLMENDIRILFSIVAHINLTISEETSEALKILSGATELPSNLKYSLRFPERPRLYAFFSQGSITWETDVTFPHFQAPGPRFPFSWEGGNSPGYVNEMFIALQHLISMELIAEVTGQNLDSFDVNIQRLPHHPYIEDYAVEALQFLLPMFIMISFSYTAVNIVRAITIEKELQLKETMKIMGLPTWSHWTAWFCKQFIYLLIIAVLVLLLLKVHWFKNKENYTDYAVFTHTSWTLIFFFLVLYLACTIFFCFMISGFFSKGSTAALFTGVIWFLSYLPSFVLMSDAQIPKILQAILCFSVNTAMAFGFHIILAEENAGGFDWGQMWQATDIESNRFVFGSVVFMMLLDSFLYMMIALYLEQVLPGPFGAPKPWYFLFHKSYWMPDKRVTASEILLTPSEDQDIVMEQDSGQHTTGIKMKNLTKVYGENVVVNNLNLDIYDNQITVLLGHNGAGKSTAISMLTGNTKPTSGSVLLAGYDIAKQTEKARANLGFCPQHNVLFNELTVREHLEFFGRLKGVTGQKLKNDIGTLITKLEMADKRDYQAGGLSGGQKRRLSVGVALCGAPRVVLLDEPTSGMDPASRRALWDLLQKEKVGRSMILTTHFMDEADILGDRVAIMSSGRLQCVGSPYFLKRHYGVGYTLVVVKDDGFQSMACTDVLGRHIPGITMKEDRGTEVTYALSNDQSHLFEAMLKDLEAKINNIKYKSYGLTTTTLEDVFMSVGSDVDPVHLESDAVEFSQNRTNSNVSSIAPIKREKLWKRHILAVWYKLWLVYARSRVLMAMQVLVPLVLVSVTLGILAWVMSIRPTIMKRALTLAEGFVETETVLTYDGNSQSSTGALAKTAYENIFKSAKVKTMKLTVINKSLDDYYLERTKTRTDMAYLRYRLLTGASFSDNATATARFSNFGYHDLAISLATVHEALLKGLKPNASLRVFNYPLEVNYRNQTNMQFYVAFLSMQLSSGIGGSLGIVSASFIMFYIKERILRAKLLQKAAGIQPVILWGSAAVFDWAWFCIICLTIVLSCAAFQVIGLATATELGRLYFAFMVYGAAMLPLHYVMSNMFSGPATGFVGMFFVNILLGQMGPQIVESLMDPQLDTKEMASVLDSVLKFFPLYSLVRSVTYLNQAGLNEWSCMRSCSYFAAIMPNFGQCSMKVMCENHNPICCVSDNPYFGWEKPGIMRYLVFMLVTGMVFWAVHMFIEYDIHHKICNSRKHLPPTLDEGAMDQDVIAEMRAVEQVKNASLRQHCLVAKNLTKYYKKYLAVNQVSFMVADAEVFGLLGVNGAGKTTTFKMLIGDEIISSGEAYVSGYSVKTEITSAHKHMGYCPQFDAVFNELTGRETLRLFLMLRGLPHQTSAHAERLAHELGFTKHLDKRVGAYSGGNKRKLSTAVALLGLTRLVFVDEPTTGVDPAAKRQVWRAIRGAARAGRGVVLTSHSMEECEALCSRLTIMANGSFQCLGTPQHLKNKFSEGFTLTIKMKMAEETIDSIAGTRGIAAVKLYVESNFITPKLMEEYQGLLTYYLPNRDEAWSKMFGIMERCRQTHDVEDYTISQTTLEQIFLQLTKYQRETQ